MIQKAESVAPSATISDANQCSDARRRASRPKSSSPRKPDSRKKAKTPSAASGAPKMSPTKRE